MRRAAFLAFGLAAFSCGNAIAQGGSEAQIRGQIDIALQYIQHVLCENDKPCEPATPAEIAKPPLTVEEGSLIIKRAILNGAAKFCHLEWVEAGFAPMMKHWRSHGKNERQMALIGILHGMAQSQTEAMLAGRACSDETRRDVQAQLSTFP